MKMKFKSKSLFKKIALALAGIAALTAVAFGVKAIVNYTKNDLKKITPSFEVGNLGTDGKYVNDESTLYTKEVFPCDGLQIKLDFDNEINYQIFFYDDLDNFVDSTAVLSDSYSGGNHDGYARLLIIPTNDEDHKISLSERVKYPRQMTIKVSKNQQVDYTTVFNKRLRVVDNLSSMRFVYSDIIEKGDSYIFVDSNLTSATSKDVLAVKAGQTISFDESSFGSVSSGKIIFSIYEFKYENGYVQFLKKNQKVSSLTIDGQTTHVIFSLSIWDYEEMKNVALTTSQVLKIIDCLSITKTK